MSCVTRAPHGPATRHVLASNGPSNYHLNFYSTNYSNQYSRKSFSKTNTLLRHKGTGYIANFRPTVYYSKEVDRTQNPSIAKLLVDNYETLTARDYIPPTQNTGVEQLPASVLNGPSGYTHNLPKICPPSSEKLSSKTSYGNGYPRKQFRSDDTKASYYTSKEDSGFTHAYNWEPITFRPTECHDVASGSSTWRPTDSSIMKRDFTHCPLLTGSEAIPLMSFRACNSNGFVKGNACPANAQPTDTKGPYLSDLHPQVAYTKGKKDPAMFSTVTHPHQYTSYTSVTYPPKNIHPHSTGSADTTCFGRKEMSGYSDNTIPKLPNPDPLQSMTVFKERYHGNNLVKEPPPVDTPRCIYPNGFTKSTRVHDNGPSTSSEEVLRKQKPYVARSIMARDPCYLDYTYRHKQRSSP